mmetsp:Transcript_94658/g.246993  ORF Transcript_94658/g.246993 Transcript_94658/m.246993 type:complete len:213 (-) Transcript_94658:578-1216(-)
MRLRKLENSLANNLGISECSLLNASLMLLTQDTSVCAGGRLRSTSSAMRWQSASTAVLTKLSSSSCASRPSAASEGRLLTLSWILPKPSTASTNSSTYVSAARSQALHTAVSASLPGSSTKHRQRHARCAAVRPMRKSRKIRAGSSPRSSRVSELFTASLDESSEEHSLESKALRMRPIWSSTSSSTARNVLTCLYCRRNLTQVEYASQACP